jgi:ABC-type antimicrobial peptide transport system permease subunit
MSIMARLRRLQRWPQGLAGLIIILFFVFNAVFPQVLAPYNPYDLVARPFTKPNSQFILGTNDIGQDILTLIIEFYPPPGGNQLFRRDGCFQQSLPDRFRLDGPGSVNSVA